MAEDRELFKQAMIEIGLDVPRSGIARIGRGGRVAGETIGLPLVIRPSFTLGGGGSGLRARPGRVRGDRAARPGASRRSHEVLIEESIAGWKEFELEVMRDGADNAVIVCSIENLDPMGVHTGDSITVAPQQTLDRPGVPADARRRDRDHPRDRRGDGWVERAVRGRSGDRPQVLIEMNPRVSRSSALASKATGFPIAKIAALLAVGLPARRDHQRHHRRDAGCFEPTLDYVVVKIPRFAFEKFPDADAALAHDEFGRRGRWRSGARSKRRSAKPGEGWSDRHRTERGGAQISLP